MFNKEKSNEFGNIEIKNTSYYKKNDYILITPSFALMYNPYKETINMEKQMDYEERKTAYINRKNELNIRKQYNQSIIDLYHNGKIILDDKEYLLKDLFIVYQDNNIFNLFNVKEKNDVEYNHAIKFIDTTAFIKLLDSSDTKVTDNIIKTSKDNLLDVIKNWDGYIHDKVNETDAIINKKIVRDDDNE